MNKSKNILLIVIVLVLNLLNGTYCIHEDEETSCTSAHLNSELHDNHTNHDDHCDICVIHSFSVDSNKNSLRTIKSDKPIVAIDQNIIAKMAFIDKSLQRSYLKQTLTHPPNIYLQAKDCLRI